MRTLFKNDKVKGSFFLTTLPDAIDNIVDNLSSQNPTTFAQIELKMMDIVARSQVEESEAYYTSTRKKPVPKGVEKTPEPKSLSDSNTSDTKECTWCRARNYTFVGHLYTDRDKLAKHKAEQGQRKSRKRAAANLVEEDVVGLSSDDDDREDVAMQADVSAYTASLPREREQSSWIFDSGASKHGTYGRLQLFAIADRYDHQVYIH